MQLQTFLQRVCTPVSAYSHRVHNFPHKNLSCTYTDAAHHLPYHNNHRCNKDALANNVYTDFHRTVRKMIHFCHIGNISRRACSKRENISIRSSTCGISNWYRPSFHKGLRESCKNFRSNRAHIYKRALYRSRIGTCRNCLLYTDFQCGIYSRLESSLRPPTPIYSNICIAFHRVSYSSRRFCILTGDSWPCTGWCFCGSRRDSK